MPVNEDDHRGEQLDRCGYNRPLCHSISSDCKARVVGQGNLVSHRTTVVLLGLSNGVQLVRGGPIIEQATHFCDLFRYFGGDVDLSTLHATTLEWDEPAGALAKVPVDESKVKPENRIPRVTSANWYVQHIKGMVPDT